MVCRSPPAQKARPSPSMTSTRMSSDASTSALSASSFCAMARLIELNAAGRFSVIVAIGPSTRRSAGSSEWEAVRGVVDIEIPGLEGNDGHLNRGKGGVTIPAAGGKIYSNARAEPRGPKEREDAIMDAKVERAVSSVDPFSHAFLQDPYPQHEGVGEAGSVVWLERYGIWGMARHQEVRDALTDWQTYCSGAGVGLSDFRKEPPWRPPSIILEADPPLHTRTRAVLNRILSPGAINVLRETFSREAESLVDRLVRKREFDGIADLAEAYPLKVFPDAVGIADEGRENLMHYGSMVFNSFGPRNELLTRAMENAAPVREWVMSKCSRAALAPEGLGMQIFHAVDAGELTEAEAGMLVRSF